MKKNCWEYKECGREPGGPNARQLGICPASVESSLEGVHEGSKAGRACWVVAGTLCDGTVQGTFGAKYKSCEQCDFYQHVRAEEKASFQYSVMLLGRLRNNAVAREAAGRQGLR